MRHFGLVLITAPAEKPVTYDQVKAHLRLDGDDEKDWVESRITAATEWAETYTGRRLISQTWTLDLDRFPADVIYMPYPPLSGLNSIVYRMADNVQITMTTAEFDFETISEPGRVFPAFGTSWPTTRGHFLDVKINFVCGYLDAAGVPDELKTAILQLVAHWFEHREAAQDGNAPQVVPIGIESLLWHWKMPEFR